MAKKGNSLPRCPLCGGPAKMGEAVVASTGKVFYAVICYEESCRLSAMPPLRLCRTTEEEAEAAWRR